MNGYDQWNHYVMSIDGQNGKVNLWADGIHVDQGRVTLNPSSTSTQPFRMGFNPSCGVSPGGERRLYLDDIRIYNRALSAAEVQQLYEYESRGVSEASVELNDQEEKPVPSLAPLVPVSGCQIHLPCDADDIVVRNGNPAIRNVIKEDDFGEVYGVVPVKKDGRSSLYFTGSRDAKVRFRSRELGPAHTICMWILPHAKKDILTLSTNSGAGAIFYVNTWRTSDRKLGIEIYKGSGFSSSGALVEYDRWQHVSYAVNFQSKTGMLYLDGRVVGKQDQMKPYGSGGDLYFGFGAGNLNADFTYKGYMSDIRVFDRALSEAEVKALYEFEKP
jgi:hypothetical protein